jgi:hypothetical protein
MLAQKEEFEEFKDFKNRPPKLSNGSCRLLRTG